MHIDKMLEVMQAYKDGKRIEMRSIHAHPDAHWTDTTVPAPTWNFPMYEYRIKPEPRKFYACLRQDGEVVFISTKLVSAKEFAAHGNRPVLTLVEQL